MEIRTFAELRMPDQRTLLFGGMGLITDGQLRPEDAAKFQQRAIAAANLIPSVPDAVRQSLERLRELHAYGVLWYDAFTVVTDLRWVVLELALRERFVDFYTGSIPLVAPDGTEEHFTAANFHSIRQAFRKGGSHAKGWRLKLQTGSRLIAMPVTLRPLLRWARREGLLFGQRNRYLEESVFADMRNEFAHGGAFRVGMPNYSARAIHDLAEIINRLWGEDTPAGRLYPTAISRDVLVIAWSPAEGEHGRALTAMPTDQLALERQAEPGWQCVVVRAVQSDEKLFDFDARYELTSFPTELLWGPGDLDHARAWLSITAPSGDCVSHLDRVFALRLYEGHVSPPCRLEILLGTPAKDHPGKWHLVRADYPMDAFGHVRHLALGEQCRNNPDDPGCAVEEVATGSWSEVVDVVSQQFPQVKPTKPLNVRVPHRFLDNPGPG